MPQPPREHRGGGAESLGLVARRFDQRAEHLPLEPRRLILLDRAETGEQLCFQRKAREQGLAKAVDRLHADRAAGAVDHRRKERTGAVDQAGALPVEPERVEIEPQLGMVHPHPRREAFVDAVRHFGRPRLGEGDAQHRVGRDAVEQQPQHARRQHLRLARPRRRAEPHVVRGVGGHCLPRVQDGEAAGLCHHASLPRPNHSSRRASWS